MGGFKMNMTMVRTTSTTGTTTTATTTTTPVSGFMKMTVTTTRNFSTLKFQGNKFCKSCRDKN